MVPVKSSPIRLAPDEMEALKRAVAVERAPFLHRLDRPVTTTRIEQPFFSRHRIVEVSSAMPMPATRVHVALAPDGTVRVLSGRLANLHAIAAAEPPHSLDDAEHAQAYANLADFWTSESEFGDVTVASFADIPWKTTLAPDERARIDELRKTLGEAIAPMTLARTENGHALSLWVVANRRLVHRRLHVPLDGKLRRDDEVRAAELPVHPGRLWGFVNGRLVPTG